MLPKELQAAINKLPKESQLLFQTVIYFYERRIGSLEAQIMEFKDQISKNSKNSSKPPSTDTFHKPAPKSLRKKSGLKAGGQKGHNGDTLKMAAQPDEIISHKVIRCECCRKNLRKQEADYIEPRQVYDIPPIQINVVEHRSEVKICCCGHINKAFPSGVNRYVQYGPNIKSMIVYLQDYQLLPYGRTKELIKDFFGHTLSTGTLYNIRNCVFEKLAPFEHRLKKFLSTQQVAGFDETGFRVMAARLWLHSCSTDDHAYYEVHQKRGPQAMDDIGILPNFKGVAVHDFWKSYFTYSCKHALCNAHLLRELTFIKERFKQTWAEELIKLFVKMKVAKERALAQGKLFLSKATLHKYRFYMKTCG